VCPHGIFSAHTRRGSGSLLCKHNFTSPNLLITCFDLVSSTHKHAYTQPNTCIDLGILDDRTSRVDEALACLRAFVARYPPYTVREPPLRQRPDMRAMRVSLVGARPLVRLTTALDVQDDHVPPLLTFADLEVLHHRLVAAGHLRGLAYVKWVCKSYEGALRKRRVLALKV
jgi:hypothetical protein